jgi:hypothetical protein
VIVRTGGQYGEDEKNDGRQDERVHPRPLVGPVPSVSVSPMRCTFKRCRLD